MFKISDLKNRQLVILDIEANQKPKGAFQEHHLLEIGAVKVRDGEIIDTFYRECKYEKLNTRISAILKKPKDYYNREELFDESIVYKKFVQWSENLMLISFGDYDEKVLHDVAKRNNLPMVRVFDFQKKLCIELLMPIKNGPSLKGFSRALNIKSDNLKHHSSIDDAELLWKSIDEYFEINESLKPLFKDKLHHIEKLRPTISSKFIDQPNTIEIKVKKDFKIIIDESCVNQVAIEFDQDKKPIKYAYTNRLSIYVYNNDSTIAEEILREKQLFDTKKEATDDLKKFRSKLINKYGCNIVLCCQSLSKTYEEILKHFCNNSLPLIYSFSNTELFVQYKKDKEGNNNYVKLVKKISKFYNPEKKDFSNNVETDFDIARKMQNN